MSNTKKYRSRIRIQHVIEENLIHILTKKLRNLPRDITRTDYINAAITHFNGIKSKDKVNIISKYKGTLL